MVETYELTADGNAVRWEPAAILPTGCERVYLDARQASVRDTDRSGGFHRFTSLAQSRIHTLRVFLRIDGSEAALWECLR